MFRFVALIVLTAAVSLHAQQTSSDVRVTVSLNQDGSRTTYQFDGSNKSAVATTSGADGKFREKIRYMLDDAGRFQSGEVFGPGDKFRYKSLYKYDAAGKMSEEAHVTRDDALINKIVFRYDATGKQSGYAVFDANGKLLGQTTPAKPRAAR